MYSTLATTFETIVTEQAGPVVFLTLDRPEARNAMNLKMVEEIHGFFSGIRDDRSIRCVVIRGAGDTFCSGADIKEWPDPANQSREAQVRYATALDDMLMAVQYAPQVTVAVIEGAAMGGGLGLVCVSDIAIADQDARMALPEVRLGLAPAVISPYVLQRVGLTRARQLALTGRTLNGFAAQEVGLVHDVTINGMMDEVVEGYIRDILEGSPEALAETKALLIRVADSVFPETRDYRVDVLNRLREGAEAAEGMAAFAQKRRPEWVPSRESFPF
jgi:isohexenylglutaconyl-CoA hydratase